MEEAKETRESKELIIEVQEAEVHKVEYARMESEVTSGVIE